MVTISLFKKNWLHACVYHHRMKPKVGRNFTSERGEGVKGEMKNISLHWPQGIFETVPYFFCYFYKVMVHNNCLVGKAWRMEWSYVLS